MKHGWRYERIAKLLEPYDLTPTEYIRELRDEDVSWPDIGRLMEQDHLLITSGAHPGTETLKRWAA